MAGLSVFMLRDSSASQGVRFFERMDRLPCFQQLKAFPFCAEETPVWITAGDGSIYLVGFLDFCVWSGLEYGFCIQRECGKTYYSTYDTKRASSKAGRAILQLRLIQALNTFSTQILGEKIIPSWPDNGNFNRDRSMPIIRCSFMILLSSTSRSTKFCVTGERIKLLGMMLLVLALGDWPRGWENHFTRLATRG